MKLKDQLAKIISDLSVLSIESTLMIGAIVLLVGGLLFKRKTYSKGMFVLILLAASYFSLLQDKLGLFLSQSIKLGELNTRFSLLLVVITGSLIFFRRVKHVREFYFMILSLLAGSLFMIKANSILLVYLSLELVSYVSYILTGFSFKKEGTESAIKYLLFGATSSAILLVGLGLLYGTTGTFYLSDMNEGLLYSLPSQVGLLLVLFGLFFKASIFPLHIWTPSVYQSAPIDAVALFSVVPKLAGLILIHNLLTAVDLPITHWIVECVVSMGIVTIVMGTFGAIRQSNTRRMIAFGSIAHSGFLLAFLVARQFEVELFWFYSVVYAIMNIGAFYFLDIFESNEIRQHRDYSHIKGQSYILILFTIVLVSLVGIPPIAGFTAKFFLFSYMWQWYQASQSPLALLWFLVSVFATVVALFYYLRVPYFYFLKESEAKMESRSIEITLSTKIIATLFGVILLLLFFAPKLVV